MTILELITSKIDFSSFEPFFFNFETAMKENVVKCYRRYRGAFNKE